MMKKHKGIMAYMLALLIFTTYVVMDTFFITRVYGEEEAGQNNRQSEQTGRAEDPDAGNMHSGMSGSGFGAENGSEDGGSHGGPKQGMRGGPGKRRGRSSTDSGSGADANDPSGTEQSQSSSVPSSGSSSVSDAYSDENISIELKEYRENNTTIYVADVKVSDPSYLKTALAQGSYGRNVTAKTSEIAESAGAILAVNGDYYGAQEKGYVIRNGKLYRDTAISNQEDLVIYEDGSFGIINESDVTARELISSGAVQTFSFGPALVQNGSVTVTENEEVGRSMASNPRTAIGMIDENHYLFVVSDGRSSESEGLTLYELAQFMDKLGAATAYNLDGGGSSTMYFNGKVVNNPTTGGMTTRERSVSDIVYIG